MINTKFKIYSSPSKFMGRSLVKSNTISSNSPTDRSIFEIHNKFNLISYTKRDTHNGNFHKRTSQVQHQPPKRDSPNRKVYQSILTNTSMNFNYQQKISLQPELCNYRHQVIHSRKNNKCKFWNKKYSTNPNTIRIKDLFKYDSCETIQFNPELKIRSKSKPILVEQKDSSARRSLRHKPFFEIYDKTNSRQSSLSRRLSKNYRPWSTNKQFGNGQDLSVTIFDFIQVNI